MQGKKTGAVSLFIFLGVILLSIPPAYALEPIWTCSTSGTSIRGVTVSADGSAIAVGAEKILLFSRNGELLAKEPYGDKVLFTPDGKHLLSSSGSTLYFFERNATQSAFQKKWDYEVPGTVQSMDISDDGNVIAASAGAGGTYVFSRAGKMTGGNEIYSAVVRVSPNGKRIVGASTQGLYRYGSTGKETRYTNVSLISAPDVMEMTSTGATAVYNDDQRLVSVNAASGSGTERWKSRATADITALAMIPSGTKILVGTRNGNVDLFNDKGTLLWSYATNPAGTTLTGVRDVALSADGKIAAAGTYEGTIMVLDAAGKELWSNVTKDHINHIAMSGDGSLVIATGDETVYAFSSTAQPLSTVRSPQVTATSVQQKNATTVPAKITSQKPATAVPTTGEATSVPTTYSVIRTATQAPVSEIVPFLGVVVAVLLIGRRRG